MPPELPCVAFRYKSELTLRLARLLEAIAQPFLEDIGYTVTLLKDAALVIQDAGDVEAGVDELTYVAPLVVYFRGREFHFQLRAKVVPPPNLIQWRADASVAVGMLLSPVDEGHRVFHTLWEEDNSLETLLTESQSNVHQMIASVVASVLDTVLICGSGG
jgi:hypothetical protein